MGPGLSRRTLWACLASVGAVLALFAVLELARGVDPVEVTGFLLFLPVAVAGLRGLKWGVGAGLLAGLVYAALRIGAVDLAGSSVINQLIGTRWAGYLVFGAAIGVSVQSLRTLSSSDIRGSETAQFRTELQRAERHRRPLTAITTSDARHLPTLRSSDFVVRHGDEVTIVLPETDAEGARLLLGRFDGSVPAPVVRSLPEDADALRLIAGTPA